MVVFEKQQNKLVQEDKLIYMATKNIFAIKLIKTSYNKLLKFNPDIEDTYPGQFIITSLFDCMEKIKYMLENNQQEDIQFNNVKIETYAKIAVKISNHLVFRIPWKKHEDVALATEIKNRAWYIFETLLRV